MDYLRTDEILFYVNFGFAKWPQFSLCQHSTEESCGTACMDGGPGHLLRLHMPWRKKGLGHWYPSSRFHERGYDSWAQIGRGPTDMVHYGRQVPASDAMMFCENTCNLGVFLGRKAWPSLNLKCLRSGTPLSHVLSSGWTTVWRTEELVEKFVKSKGFVQLNIYD